MSQPGWYPDPAGAPGQFRYWDGTAWSHQTTSSPGSAPPHGSRQPTAEPKRPWRWVAGLVACVLIVVLAVVVWRHSRSAEASDTEPITSAPTVSAWDETSSTSSTPDASPSPLGTAVDCPTKREGELTVVNGRITGVISAPLIEGWAMTRQFGIPGVRRELGQTLPVTATWVNVSLVGTAYRSDGFTTANQTARMITECFTSSAHYPDDSLKREVVSEDTTVQGHPAHHIRTEMYVTNFGPSIKGGVIDIVAVDTGDGDTIGVYLSAINMGDADTQAQADRVRANLCVTC